jgi:pimeloyl-ACP methyl ester carboxylesterase
MEMSMNDQSLAFAAADRFIETPDGQQLFYEDVGAGRPVVFIHGWTLGSAIWRGQLDWLAAHGLRAVAYDRRGHGRSSKPESGYDYDRLADDLACLIDRLDLADVVVVGHSMGSGEVVRYFARHGADRIARAMLVAPTTPFGLGTADNPDGVDGQMYQKIIDALRTDLRGYFIAGMAGLLGAGASPALIDWAMSIALQASLPARIGCMRALSATDFRPEMGAVTVPTAILCGTADAPDIIASARRTHMAIPDSRLEIYDDAPHALFVTERERFNRELLRFARS